jgi:hypothetical protein
MLRPASDGPGSLAGDPYRMGAPLRLDLIRSAATTKAELPFGSPAVVGSRVPSVCGVAQEARTRSFASPALAGFALVVVL